MALPEGAARDGREIELQLARGLSLFTVKGFIVAEAAQAYTRVRELAERYRARVMGDSVAGSRDRG
jgi:hypothetical protein